MYINTFKYTPKDVSCQLCTEYVKKLGCTALRCPWLAERIEAGVVGYREAVLETFPHERRLFQRLNLLIKHYPGSLWSNEQHERRMQYQCAVQGYQVKRQKDQLTKRQRFYTLPCLRQRTRRRHRGDLPGRLRGSVRYKRLLPGVRGKSHSGDEGRKIRKPPRWAAVLNEWLVDGKSSLPQEGEFCKCYPHRASEQMTSPEAFRTETQTFWFSGWLAGVLSCRRRDAGTEPSTEAGALFWTISSRWAFWRSRRRRKLGIRTAARFPHGLRSN